MVQEKILINGLEISFKIERKGSDKNFLILHGWGSRSDRWEKVSRIISEKGFNVIVPDLPGFGESQEPRKPWSLDDYCKFVEEFSKQLKLQTIYLLGHSFGGSLAVKFALRFPGQIAELFLVGAACVRKRTFKKNLSNRIAKILKIFSFLPFYSLIRKGIYRYIFKSDYIYNEGVMQKSYLNVIQEDLTDILGAVRPSTVIIWGQDDNVTPLRDAYLIKKKINNSKLVIIQKGDHDLERKMPDVLAQRIIENIK